MTSPAAYQPDQSDDSPSAVDEYDQATPMSPFDEIRKQLHAWVRELEQEPLTDSPSSAGHEIPSPCSGLTPAQATAAHIEFLSALSHDELLDAAVELHAERNTLFRRLGSLPDLSQLAAMEDRLQQAVAEIESLRARNEEFEAALAAQNGAHADDQEGYTEDQDYHEDDEEFETDWEAQKNQWLHRLQADEPSSASPVNKAEQAKAEKQTQLIRKLKDENADLRRKLDEQTEAEKILDQDEVIHQERQRLTELQQEWETKLRQAEVDISRERAEITRNKKKLEERERTLEALQEQLDQGPKESSGKWRGLLGLN